MDRVPCRYFYSSGCRFGERCRFSHSAETATCPKEPCRFYLQGFCAAGDTCRFEHVESPDFSFADREPSDASDASSDQYWPEHELHLDLQQLSLSGGEETEQQEDQEYHSAEEHVAGASEAPEDRPVCQQYCASGRCQQGAACRYVHGLPCQSCGRNAIHPNNTQQREAHTRECQSSADRVAALRRSREVECAICLERVLDKTHMGDCQFGLLDCEHSFCLGCIRGWRSHLDGGADLDSALRTCPVCRCPAWFVTPSRTWPASQEEKAAIRSAYMSKLATIDCKHFDFGQGTCPFGSSCFYRHSSRDGTPQAVQTRWYSSADGEHKSYQRVWLSEFLAESGLVHS